LKLKRFSLRDGTVFLVGLNKHRSQKALAESNKKLLPPLNQMAINTIKIIWTRQSRYGATFFEREMKNMQNPPGSGAMTAADLSSLGGQGPTPAPFAANSRLRRRLWIDLPVGFALGYPGSRAPSGAWPTFSGGLSRGIRPAQLAVGTGSCCYGNPRLAAEAIDRCYLEEIVAGSGARNCLLSF
jgi:hypothetical protein